MIAFHEAKPEDMATILAHGLKRTSRGEKGDDSDIIRTDQLLDEWRPDDLRKAGWSRDNNLYAYVVLDGVVIDITNGQRIPVTRFVASAQQSLLELTVDPDRCFVSDLDLYDELMHAIHNERAKAYLQQIAERYFNTIQPLSLFDGASIVRAELMIPYDIPPHDLRNIS